MGQEFIPNSYLEQSDYRCRPGRVLPSPPTPACNPAKQLRTTCSSEPFSQEPVCAWFLHTLWEPPPLCLLCSVQQVQCWPDPGLCAGRRQGGGRSKQRLWDTAPFWVSVPAGPSDSHHLVLDPGSVLCSCLPDEHGGGGEHRAMVPACGQACWACWAAVCGYIARGCTLT